MSEPEQSSQRPAPLRARVALLMPGVLVAVLIALASRFISEHYGAPAMLLALLFGIALNFLGDEPRCRGGIDMAARGFLRLGVALLGLRISLDMVAALGWPVVALVVALVPATLAIGLLAARAMGFPARFGVLSAGAVAICGASAALAIAAVLPRDREADDRLVFTVVGVTLLSTVAMILYPVLAQALALSDRAAGVYLGATIHDVAQVVGAGFSISDTAGETATLVKLLRVAMLAPVVIVTALVFRAAARAAAPEGAARPPLIPAFVVGFVALAALNSAVALPAPVLSLAAEGSGWLLLTAIAAVGARTRPADILKVGRRAAVLLLIETLFLATLVAGAVTLLPVVAI